MTPSKYVVVDCTDGLDFFGEEFGPLEFDSSGKELRAEIAEHIDGDSDVTHVAVYQLVEVLRVRTSVSVELETAFDATKANASPRKINVRRWNSSLNEIANLLAAGYTDHQISTKLNLKMSSVKRYINKIAELMNADITGFGLNTVVTRVNIRDALRNTPECYLE